MKAFSKEWWLKKGLRFELGTCFKRSIEQQHKLAMFCFKRYAEAHHREKMEDILIEFMDSLRDYVAESGTNIAHDERDSSEFVEIFMKNKEIIEKIKG